ncbi:hypothetical protein L1049_003858 [Liquidambar formosana]|uniref:DUF506 family protein n=1 Tax=Liquidambar formosana TaxID=63359 RepID=A0AAP0RQY0_LIQFO
MACFVRAKRVTDPLDDKMKARLVGTDLSYVSSGSEHDVVQDDSPCLFDLVHGFLEEDGTKTESQETHSDSERVDSLVDLTVAIRDLLDPTVVDNADTFKCLLSSHVSKAVEVFSCFRSNKPLFRRNVMAYLRNYGHNAAICKTKWESSGGKTAGNYEFIDVVNKSESSTWQTRYFIDVDFAGEFEVARPTEQYTRLIQALPRVFVGKGEDLKRIVKAMCDAAKRSLKSRDLLLPPWRKNRYMQMKWFGPYRRTSNHVPANPLLPATVSKFTVKCRSVGFDAVSDVNGGYFVRIR